jgi:DNA-binding FadR family transcriptional regulator
LSIGNPLQFLRKVTEVRGIIESEASTLSAGRAAAEEVDDIRIRFDRLDASLNDEGTFDYEDYLEADMAFHAAILEASHNELLAQIGRTMNHAIRTARQEDVHDIGTILIYHPFHAAIMEAIARRQPEAAGKASREMFALLCEEMSRDAA